ncbi:hypothetical protein [Salinibacillus aidingensis]|uniref:hypothetical protein n=1 Tax=Salinibacillus aidingensis TaxID=237684 RepID=UPI0031D94F63
MLNGNDYYADDPELIKERLMPRGMLWWVGILPGSSKIWRVVNQDPGAELMRMLSSFSLSYSAADREILTFKQRTRRVNHGQEKPF